MSAERVIVGRCVFTGEGRAVPVAGGRIRAIEAAPAPNDVWIGPGLVDLQVNGYRGVDLNREGVRPNDVIALVGAMRRTGVTTFLPTIVTASEARIRAALAAIAEARRGCAASRRAIPFVHVEGPWISPLDGPRGAHPAEHARAPDLAEFARWQEACDGLVGMITLSPHWDEAPETITALARAGVRVSIGHTHAGPAAILAAIDAGARFSTHLGNGCAAMLPRHPNAIWTQLADDRLTRMFIADGHHLSADVFKVMLRACGDKALLVSDVVALAGLAPGEYDAPIGGKVELSAAGRLSVVGTPYLAGAATALIDTIPRAMAMADLPLATAWEMASTRPGAIAGAAATIMPGSPADLVAFRFGAGADRFEILDVPDPEKTGVA